MFPYSTRADRVACCHQPSAAPLLLLSLALTQSTHRRHLLLERQACLVLRKSATTGNSDLHAYTTAERTVVALPLSPLATPRTSRRRTPLLAPSTRCTLCLASCPFEATRAPPRRHSMSHPSSQPRSAALAEATQRSPTLSRPPDDEVQTLLTGFTARRPTQAVTAALRSISAICSNLNISRDRIVFNWFKTVTGLLKRGAGGQWAYDSWDKSQKVTFGRSLKVIEKNVLKAQRTGFQAVLDVLVRRGSCPGCFQESL